MAQGQRFGQRPLVRAECLRGHGHGDDRHNAVVAGTRAAHDRHVPAAHPQVRGRARNGLDTILQGTVRIVLGKRLPDAEAGRCTVGVVEDGHVHPGPFQHLGTNGVVNAHGEVPQVLKTQGHEFFRPVVARLRRERLLEHGLTIRHNPLDVIVLVRNRA